MTAPKPSTLPLGHEWVPCSVVDSVGCSRIGRCHYATAADKDTCEASVAAHEAPPTTEPAHICGPEAGCDAECAWPEPAAPLPETCEICGEPNKVIPCHPATPLPQPVKTWDGHGWQPSGTHDDMECEICGERPRFHNKKNSAPLPQPVPLVMVSAAGNATPEDTSALVDIVAVAKRATLNLPPAPLPGPGSLDIYKGSELDQLLLAGWNPGAPLPQERETERLREELIYAVAHAAIKSYQKHEIERDGWTEKDECYRRDILEAGRQALSAFEAALRDSR